VKEIEFLSLEGTYKTYQFLRQIMIC